MLADWTLDTPLIVLPGMSEAEIEELWKATYLRSRWTRDFVEGKIDPETYLDFMASQGFEPCDLLDQAEANFEFAVNEGIALEL